MPIGGYISDHEVLASAARTTSGQTNSFKPGEFQSQVIYYINVTVASGTGRTMVFKLQDSPDDSNWYDLGEEVIISAVDTYRLPITDYGKYVRGYYTIAGTSASFTFQVDLIGRY